MGARVRLGRKPGGPVSRPSPAVRGAHVERGLDHLALLAHDQHPNHALSWRRRFLMSFAVGRGGTPAVRAGAVRAWQCPARRQALPPRSQHRPVFRQKKRSRYEPCVSALVPASLSRWRPARIAGGGAELRSPALVRPDGPGPAASSANASPSGCQAAPAHHRCAAEDLVKHGALNVLLAVVRAEAEGLSVHRYAEHLQGTSGAALSNRRLVGPRGCGSGVSQCRRYGGTAAPGGAAQPGFNNGILALLHLTSSPRIRCRDSPSLAGGIRELRWRACPENTPRALKHLDDSPKLLVARWGGRPRPCRAVFVARPNPRARGGSLPAELGAPIPSR
jgi:hypothetical protein